MTTEAQREAARKNMLAMHARKAAERAQAGASSIPASPDDAPAVGDSVLKVNVKTATDPPKKIGLRERLGLGAKQATPAPAKRRPVGKSAKPNLVVTLLPTIIASLVATYARDRLPVEYQACAPTKEEVNGIIGPLMDMIGRRVEVAAEVSQDILDITNSLICGLAYGARAYVTYVNIKKTKEVPGYAEKQQRDTAARREQFDREAREYNEGYVEAEPNFSGGLRAYQAQNTGVGLNPIGVNGSGPGKPVNGVSSNGANNPDGDPELRKQEAALIADMFKRDRAGRERLGNL